MVVRGSGRGRLAQFAGTLDTHGSAQCAEPQEGHDAVFVASAYFVLVRFNAVARGQRWAGVVAYVPF